MIYWLSNVINIYESKGLMFVLYKEKSHEIALTQNSKSEVVTFRRVCWYKFAANLIDKMVDVWEKLSKFARVFM